MKKLFLSTILFMLALTVVADNPLHQLLKHQRTDLTTGITMSDMGNPADFTIPFGPIVKPSAPIHPHCWGTLDSPFAYSWYPYDFSEQPFDGKIDILVVGEPLPSTTTTIFVLTLFAGIIYCRRFKNLRPVV